MLCRLGRRTSDEKSLLAQLAPTLRSEDAITSPPPSDAASLMAQRSHGPVSAFGPAFPRFSIERASTEPRSDAAVAARSAANDPHSRADGTCEERAGLHLTPAPPSVYPLTPAELFLVCVTFF